MATARDVDKLSAEVETLCCDWRRMRSVIERLARMPWWDLRTLRCLYCQSPFDVATGECAHEPDCVFDRACRIAGSSLERSQPKRVRMNRCGYRNCRAAAR